MSENSPVIIFGPGYTAGRLALRLIGRDIPVFAIARDPSRLSSLVAAGVTVASINGPKLPENARIVYSIPPLPGDESEVFHRLIGQLNPRRLIYISSTSIYGNQTAIDENSPINTVTDRARRRHEEELHLSAGSWSTLILRPAAIYGPGRGVHVRVRSGLLARGASSQVTSRIHVDDLVQLIEAGLESNLEGAWPVADEHACQTTEIAAWCAQYFGVPLPMTPLAGAQDEGRDVNGLAIFRALGRKIHWATWQTGIPACLAEESESNKRS